MTEKNNKKGKSLRIRQKPIINAKDKRIAEYCSTNNELLKLYSDYTLSNLYQNVLIK